MKRYGSAVFLMELIVVILFFSLSVVVTLRMFVTSHIMDEQSEQITGALVCAQNVAEQFKASGTGMFGSDWTKSASSDGSRRYISTNDEGFSVEVILNTVSDSSGTMEAGKVGVYALSEPEEPVCSLEIGRYEAGIVNSK
jgi:hypothetical protein